MKSAWFTLLAVTALVTTGSPLRAQQPTPHIGYVYPAGGQQGATIEVAIGGQYFAGEAKVYPSGSGVKAQVLEYSRPITQQQFNDVRDRLKELRGKPKDDAVLKEIAELQKKLTTFVKRANPAIAESMRVRLVIASMAEPGPRELRLATAAGLSNPVAFQIGQLPEYTQKPSPPQRDPRTGKLVPREVLRRQFGLELEDRQEMTIAIPAVVNGQIMPGEVDRYRFTARKGQQLVVATSARQLIPYLADAVPGWFQATVALYDSDGNELVYDDHWRFHPDPVVFCKIPKDGQYVMEIRDSLYRGRDDFVYRVSLSEQPFVTSIFPLGGPVGSPTLVELKGGNLPVTQVTMDPREKSPGTWPLIVSNDKAMSNEVSFATDTLPECQEQEPNNDVASAQRVTLPIMINGRVERRDDRDVFCFQAQAGQSIVAEVDARRLGSPLDSVLRLTDASGKQLAFNDDHEDRGDGLTTHHADSLLSATLPSDGLYYVHLGDAQHQGGTAWGYRLRISPPRPDFELRVVPSSVSGRAGMSVPITVYALRKDGFEGEISLALRTAPKGCSLCGGRIPAGEDKLRLTLTVPIVDREEPFHLRLEGHAAIAGHETHHLAVPADDMMQAFAYHHLVPAKNWMLAVVGQGRSAGPVRLLAEQPVRLPASGTATVKFSMPKAPILDQISLELNEPPAGITIQDTARTADGMSIRLRANSEKVKAGLRGNLIVDAYLDREGKGNSAKPRAGNKRVKVATLPAVPFEIVAQR